MNEWEEETGTSTDFAGETEKDIERRLRIGPYGPYGV